MALGVLGMTGAVLPATAQQGQETEQLERIVVVAPYVTQKRETGSLNGPVVTEKTAYVTYADLDLTRAAGVDQLKQRVREAATRLCEELDRAYPSGGPSPPACAREALVDAMKQVRQAARKAKGA